MEVGAQIRGGKGRDVGNSLGYSSGSLNFENNDSMNTWSSRSGNMAGLLQSDHGSAGHSYKDQIDSRSLPDLPSEYGLKNPTSKTKMDSTKTYKHQPEKNENKRNKQGKEMSHLLKTESGKFVFEDPHPQFSKHIYKASEIIQASDNTDDDGEELTSRNEWQVDQEMANILNQLKMVSILRLKFFCYLKKQKQIL